MDKVLLAVTYMKQHLELFHTLNGSPEKEIHDQYALFKDLVLISPSATELSTALFMAFVGASPGSAPTAGRNLFLLLLVHLELLESQQSAEICISDVQGCIDEWPWRGQHFN